MAPLLLAGSGVGTGRKNLRLQTNHYRTLGISPAASQKKIEVAFWEWQVSRRQGRVDPKAYLLAEEAYHLLSDPVSRAVYDRRLGLRRHPAWEKRSRSKARASFERGMNHMARGNYRSALKAVRSAVRLDPGEAVPRSFLGLLLALNGGCLHLAERHGRLALRQAPGVPAISENLSRIYRMAGLRKRATRFRVGWRRFWPSLRHAGLRR